MRIIMVCLGNICRSPLAQGILEKKIEDHQLDWQVDSAGTSSWHIGESPDPRSVAKAEEYSVDISGQRARQFSQSDFDHFDKILVMDASNYQDVLALARNGLDRSKIEFILNYTDSPANQAVPDPYFDGGFERVYQLLDAACEKILARHRKHDFSEVEK